MNNDFYRECARLLNTTHEGQPFPYRYRTRWNNRVAGQGRFPNHGIIRIFGDMVHVALTSPTLNFVGTKEEVLARLRDETITP